MPATITATPSDAPQGQSKKGAASAPATIIPFARASKYHIEQGDTKSAIVINAAAPGTYNFPVPSYGYLAAVLLSITATGGTGSAGVYYEDAPWSIIQSIALYDVNGVPIYQVTGYDAYLIAKFGAYRLFGLDLATQYAAPSSGNFSFILPLFLEFGQDGLGALPNMDASARYNLQVILASATASASGPVFTTAPTTYPTLSMQLEVLCRAQPTATDLYGNKNSTTPPGVGTVQYWTAQTFTGLANGANTLQLTRVGNMIRNHLLIWRNANGTRASAEGADVPGLFEMDWDAGPRYIANTATLRFLQFLQSGYNYPAGCLLLQNTTDPDHVAVAEYGDEWMQTLGATKLTLRYSAGGGAGTLRVLTNDIVPASAQVFGAPSLALG